MNDAKASFLIPFCPFKIIMEGRFVKKIEELIILLQIYFFQYYRVVRSGP